MKLTPYKKLLTMTKEAIDAVLVPVRSRAAQKQAELEMIKLEEKLATIESNLSVECSKKEINFDRIIEKLDEYALAERRKKQFERIISEMFPEE
jgi:5'-3' exonuclease